MSLNTEGFKSGKTCKLDDPDFCRESISHDIVTLTETHAGPSYHIGLEGYTTVKFKHKKARKHFGLDSNSSEK